MAHPPRGTAAPLARRSLALAATLLLWGCADAPAPSGDDVPVRVDRIAVDHDRRPVIVLEEEGGPRWLPIWIGSDQAHSIAIEMEQRPSPRPNSHDLARDLIHGLEGSVERVVVTELRNDTYYALIQLARDGERVEIDARPSDAIAIALRDGAPIFVRASLFRELADGDESRPRREI